jgi:hypothetical protein
MMTAQKGIEKEKSRRIKDKEAANLMLITKAGHNA